MSTSFIAAQSLTSAAFKIHQIYRQKVVAAQTLEDLSFSLFYSSRNPNSCLLSIL